MSDIVKGSSGKVVLVNVAKGENNRGETATTYYNVVVTVIGNRSKQNISSEAKLNLLRAMGLNKDLDARIVKALAECERLNSLANPTKVTAKVAGANIVASF